MKNLQAIAAWSTHRRALRANLDRLEAGGDSLEILPGRVATVPADERDIVIATLRRDLAEHDKAGAFPGATAAQATEAVDAAHREFAEMIVEGRMAFSNG